MGTRRNLIVPSYKLGIVPTFGTPTHSQKRLCVTEWKGIHDVQKPKPKTGYAKFSAVPLFPFTQRTLKPEALTSDEACALLRSAQRHNSNEISVFNFGSKIFLEVCRFTHIHLPNIRCVSVQKVSFNDPISRSDLSLYPTSVNEIIAPPLCLHRQPTIPRKFSPAQSCPQGAQFRL